MFTVVDTWVNKPPPAVKLATVIFFVAAVPATDTIARTSSDAAEVISVSSVIFLFAIYELF